MSIRESNKFKTVEFMIIDDDEVSVMAIKRAMNQLNLANPILVAQNGLDALEILYKAIGEDKTLPPFIITLDLSMPKMGGLEFLDKIRNDPIFNKLVIFVLTTSDAPTDIASAYNKNIAGYIVKENPTESFRDALKLLHDYAQLVVLPE